MWNIEKMNRRDAIKRIASYDFSNLEKAQKSDLIENYWSESEGLSEKANYLIRNNDFPINYDRDALNEIAIFGLMHSMLNVENSYLETRLLEIGESDKIIDEHFDCPLLPCPCCGYKTLEGYGDYDICHVCKWEDDGLADQDVYSSANRSTLRDYRNTFLLKKDIVDCNKWAK
jgi:hypothetical protein